MIKPLLITSLCATIGGIGFLSLAAASAAAHDDNVGLWRLMGDDVDGGGPVTTRDLTWSGGDRLGISIPAEVHFTQGPTASLRITGPKGMVDHVIVADGKLEYDRRVRSNGRMQIVMTAPDVTKFSLAGSQKLDIAGYDQPELETHIAGSGDIVAVGKATRLKVGVAGSGDVDLSAVAAEDANVHIAGSGDVVMAPTQSVEVHIAGSGDVTLKSRPAHVESHVAGSGKIIQDASDVS